MNRFVNNSWFKKYVRPERSESRNCNIIGKLPVRCESEHH